MKVPVVLVSGGAGYIGSHFMKAFANRGGVKVLCVDDFSTGHRWAVQDCEFVHLKVGVDPLDELFQEFDIIAVVHFAASSIVSESVAFPLKYYQNNISSTAALLKCCLKYGVNRFVLSSTASVYGDINGGGLISETSPVAPVNPYGRSKLVCEWMLQDASLQSNSFRFLVLRYFNVAGAHSSNTLGECHDPETHLIPKLAKAVLASNPSFSVYGRDYPTKDGTCIRDYIHVEDLASAHVSALDYLLRGGRSETVNCGYGRGYSVMEVVESMERVSGCKLDVNWCERRAGDPAVLVANTDKLVNLLGWKAKYDDLDVICSTALEWEKYKASIEV
ncbi:UDP-glucose 4-epimerase GalE [Stutzerimonas nitrititolerans]|uniref:UDP-glucose 4-epimerase GalE n=1 Tax=Stutzerimonas nitrititolerans TaxID=2482751 RepID=UPI00289ACEA5|nr:UDP-glucose 4-epimerase GalE [Stutzerimonas nitrititolerans]